MKSKVNAENVVFQNIEESHQFNKGKQDFYIQVFFLYLGLCGCVYSLLTAFSIQESAVIYYLIFIPICFALNYLFYDTNIIKRRIRIGLIIIVLLAGLVCFQMLWKSFYGFLKQMSIGISMSNSGSPVFFILFISFFVAYLYAYLLNRGLKIIASVITLLSVFVPYFIGYSPKLLPMVIVMMFVIGESILYHKETETISNSSGKVAVSVVIMIYAVYLLLHLFYVQTYFDHNKPFTKISNHIMSIWNNSMDNKGTEVTGVGGINMGELGQIDKITYRNISMLTLNAGYRGTFYLRGYVGANYGENRWNDLSEEQRLKSHDMFQLFESENFDVYNLSSRLYKIIDNDNQLMKQYIGDQDYFKTVYCRNFRVTYQNASQNLWYFPYNSNLMLEGNESNEYPIDNETGEIVSSNYHIEQMDYDAIKDLIDQYQGDNEDLIKYCMLEHQYRDYVYHTYTGVNADLSKELSQTIDKLPQAQSNMSTSDKISYAKKLTSYFKDNYKYSLEPGRVPDDKDFVSYFLNESKQGYCTYFASAATLLLRQSGIPARYVEGYKVKVSQDNTIYTREINTLRKSKVLNVNDKYKEYIVNVLDRDAHAWVEIYADGVGWIPVDVTPSTDNSSGVIATKATEGIGTQTSVTSTEIDSQENNVGDTLYADMELEEEGKVIVRQDNPETVGLYRERLLNKYHSLAQYLFENKYDAIDIIVFGNLLKHDIIWFFLLLLKILTVFVIAAVLIYIPTKVREIKRSNMLQFIPDKSYEEYEKQLLSIHHYLERLGHFYKVVRKDTMTYKQWANELENSQECFANHQIGYIVDTILAVSFSDNKLSQNTIKKVIESAHMIQLDSYSSCQRFVKLKYRFLYNLK